MVLAPAASAPTRHDGNTVQRTGGGEVARQLLLACGVASSALYVFMNVVAATRYPGYSFISQTVSELSAIGVPSRRLWNLLVVPYALLGTAFGYGVWLSARGRRALRVAGALLIAYGVSGVFWPTLAPMHQRPVLAAGGGTLSDTMHIVLSVVTVIIMLAAMGFSAAALGPRFRRYVVATMIALVGFGALTSVDGPKIGRNLPTPWIGVWERMDIALFLAWVVVLAVTLWRRDDALGEAAMPDSSLGPQRHHR